jgi:hypothetical protein
VPLRGPFPSIATMPSAMTKWIGTVRTVGWATRPLPCQSSVIRFYNDLQLRGGCLSTRKSCKTSLFVGWIVG